MNHRQEPSGPPNAGKSISTDYLASTDRWVVVTRTTMRSATKRPSAVVFGEAHQVGAIRIASKLRAETRHIGRRDVSHAPRDLFRAGNLESLSVLDGRDEGRSLEEGLVGTR